MVNRSYTLVMQMGMCTLDDVDDDESVDVSVCMHGIDI